MMYLKFISSAFQRSAAYRLEYYIGLFNAFLYIFIFTSVWKAVASTNPDALPGWDETKLVQYAILSTLIKVSFGRNESLVSTKVKNGDIVYDFLKPYNFALMYFSDCIGVSLFQLFARALPLLFFSFLFFGISPSMDLMQFLMFLPTYFFAFIIFILIGFIISSLSFFFTEIFTFFVLNSAFLTLFSGSVIPVSLYPDQFQELIYATPFPYLFYFPTALIINTPLTISYPELVLRYLFIIAILGTIAYKVFNKGKKKIEFAGG